MRRVIVALHIKRSVLIAVIIILFLTFLPLLIVGTGGNKGLNSSGLHVGNFDFKVNDIVFNNSNGGGPLIKIFISGENKVKEIYLEEYIRGVVAAEVPASFEKEAMKAQAVAARTFALSRLTAFGGNKCSKGNGADLCDTAHCQVYLDKDKRLSDWNEKDRGAYWNKFTEAVKETTGQVLTYDGRLVMSAMYFSVSGGKTEDAAEVFSFSEPYLKSVSSPGEEIAPKYIAAVKISNNELARKINSTYPKAKVTSSSLKSQIKISKRTMGGAVKEISLGSAIITGPQFRSLLGLNSSNFDIKFGSNEVEITTHGYGHGVGMSQWGANVMAKAGKSYMDILTHYYSGVRVEKFNN